MPHYRILRPRTEYYKPARGPDVFLRLQYHNNRRHLLLSGRSDGTAVVTDSEPNSRALSWLQSQMICPLASFHIRVSRIMSCMDTTRAINCRLVRMFYLI